MDEKKSTREGLGEALLELAESIPEVTVLTADLCESTRTNLFKDKYPERFIEAGISEANMIGMAAGLAAMGKIPFATTFGVFSPGRCLDQIRVSICYSNHNVKLVSTHCGIHTGQDGATHQATEDIAIMRSMPNMTVIVPCDFYEAKKAVWQAAQRNGPHYIRLGRNKLPITTTPESHFEIGKAEVLKQGSDATIIACGLHVHEALVASQELEAQDIHAAVINCHTIKPLDQETIVSVAKTTGAIVTAEDHQRNGGLGSAVAELLAQYHPVPIEFIAIDNQFGQSGTPEELLREYHLTSQDIKTAVHHVIARKSN
jgi:transketolase